MENFNFCAVQCNRKNSNGARLYYLAKICEPSNVETFFFQDFFKKLIHYKQCADVYILVENVKKCN